MTQPRATPITTVGQWLRAFSTYASVYVEPYPTACTWNPITQRHRPCSHICAVSWTGNSDTVVWLGGCTTNVSAASTPSCRRCPDMPPIGILFTGTRTGQRHTDSRDRPFGTTADSQDPQTVAPHRVAGGAAPANATSLIAATSRHVAPVDNGDTPRHLLDAQS